MHTIFETDIFFVNEIFEECNRFAVYLPYNTKLFAFIAQ